MIRNIIVALLLGVACVAAGVAAGDEKDPVKEKLFAAKIAYDKDMSAYRTAVGEWLDSREEAARKAGDKKAVDAVKADRKAFDEDGILPKPAPAAIQQKPAQARKTLEAVYAQAVKDYVKAKKDDEAAAVEKEWKAFIKTAAGTLDLLAPVDPKAHGVDGEWKKDGKVLVGVVGNFQAHVQLPYEPGEEYDLELTGRRVKGVDGVGVGLVAGGRPVLVYIDGLFPDRGYESGFELVDNKPLTTFKGSLLKTDKDFTITCSVRTGKIDLLVGGKAAASFKGDFARLSIPPAHRLPNTKALFILLGGSKGACSYQFDRVEVTPVKGKGTILK